MFYRIYSFHGPTLSLEDLCSTQFKSQHAFAAIIHAIFQIECRIHSIHRDIVAAITPGIRNNLCLCYGSIQPVLILSAEYILS